MSVAHPSGRARPTYSRCEGASQERCGWLMLSSGDGIGLAEGKGTAEQGTARGVSRFSSPSTPRMLVEKIRRGDLIAANLARPPCLPDVMRHGTVRLELKGEQPPP
jgi:hypothetical protein